MPKQLKRERTKELFWREEGFPCPNIGKIFIDPDCNWKVIKKVKGILLVLERVEKESGKR